MNKVFLKFNLYSVLLIFLCLFMLNSCLTKEEEPLNYNDTSDFYGTWQIFYNNPLSSNEVNSEYIRFNPDGSAVYLKLYASEYYPVDMFDVKNYTWSISLNDLNFDIMTYHVDYFTGNEIFCNGGKFKLKKLPDAIIDLYTNGSDDYKYKSIDENGNILNYKKIKDFYGSWRMSYDNTSFGSEFKKGYTYYLKVYPGGTLKLIEVNNTGGDFNIQESSWDVKKNIFYWGIINYDIEYCKEADMLFSRSATKLLFQKVADTIVDYYLNYKEDSGSTNKDPDADILNYKDISDFYGYWEMKYGENSFANDYFQDNSIYIILNPNGTLQQITVSHSTGYVYKNECKWSIEKNTFRWDIINYDIDYCREKELSLSRSGTQLLLSRIQRDDILDYL